MLGLSEFCLTDPTLYLFVYSMNLLVHSLTTPWLYIRLCIPNIVGVARADFGRMSNLFLFFAQISPDGLTRSLWKIISKTWILWSRSLPSSRFALHLVIWCVSTILEVRNIDLRYSDVVNNFVTLFRFLLIWANLKQLSLELIKRFAYFLKSHSAWSRTPLLTYRWCFLLATVLHSQTFKIVVIGFGFRGESYNKTVNIL